MSKVSTRIHRKSYNESLGAFIITSNLRKLDSSNEIKNASFFFCKLTLYFIFCDVVFNVIFI